MKRFLKRCLKALLPLAAVGAAAWLFFTGLHDLDRGQSEQGVQQLEQALRRAAVSCYATEGCYPADAAYLSEYYGVQIDEERYLVHYAVFAENLMPEITVTVKMT